MVVNLATTWPDRCGDGCGEFFGACLAQAQPDVPDTARCLEIGCAEWDWLDVAATSWPTMTLLGIDWRCGNNVRHDGRVTTQQADTRDGNLFAPGSFDLITSISAIEHVGLGHYSHDPIDPDGDTKAIANAFTWLKPGGWLLFDVPYDRTGYRVHGTEYRVYDDGAIWDRLWVEPLVRAKGKARWKGTFYATAGLPHVLIEKPTTSLAPSFHYVGFAWQKV